MIIHFFYESNFKLKYDQKSARIGPAQNYPIFHEKNIFLAEKIKECQVFFYDFKRKSIKIVLTNCK